MQSKEDLLIIKPRIILEDCRINRGWIQDMGKKRKPISISQSGKDID
jgi:hypothetical protein